MREHRSVRLCYINNIIWPVFVYRGFGQPTDSRVAVRWEKKQKNSKEKTRYDFTRRRTIDKYITDRLIEQKRLDV